MRKKTSTIIGIAIATILIGYISALTISNQAFAQINPNPSMQGTTVNAQPGHDHVPHVGQILVDPNPASPGGTHTGDCLNNNPPCQANVKELGHQLINAIKAVCESLRGGEKC
jgi:hypothetical protein